jgi:Uncharacterised protein family (UPF0236)
MNIKNYESIVSQGEEKVQQICKTFYKDIEEMAISKQLNINSTEELMLIFLKKIKGFLTFISGMFLSNLDTENNSNIRYNDLNEEFKLLKKEAPIQILTVLGKIDITRDYYFSRSKFQGFGETDEILEISNKHRMTKGMMETITYAAQKDDSFKEGSESIKKYMDLDVSIKQMQLISEEVGEYIFKQDTEEASKLFDLEVEKKAESEPIKYFSDEKDYIYVFADGSMVSITGKDNWKEMKLGLVLNSCDIVRRALENLDVSKKEFVAYLGNKDEFKKALFASAIRAGYKPGKKVIAVGDGAKWIWDMFEELFPGCVKILDYYHFSENVHEYAQFAFEKDEVLVNKWVKEITDLAYSDKISEITIKIEEIESKKTRPANVVNLLNYISTKKELITYGKFEKAGYIIGSGAIESGNKIVIQKRLKQSGMHWSVEGAQYIATLRAKYKSDLWQKVISTIYEEILVA